MNDALNRDHALRRSGTAQYRPLVLEARRTAGSPDHARNSALSPASITIPTCFRREQVALEAEIDDEWSPAQEEHDLGDQVVLTLIFPHRRAGTLPLNAAMRHIFPTARRTQRIAVTLVDGQDGEEYPGWVVRQDRYVFGLDAMYQQA